MKAITSDHKQRQEGPTVPAR